MRQNTRTGREKTRTTVPVSGLLCDGPSGIIGFVPRVMPHDFRAFFTGAEAWGHLVQSREGEAQTKRLGETRGQEIARRGGNR